jgi:density-regulated protein DRP1
MDTPDDNCEKWLLKTHPETHSDLYNKDDDEAEGTEGDAKKKNGKKIKAAVTLKGTVIIKRIERHKRKFVIAVQGLENFDIELKKAAKLFANKFATGSSVTKSPQGNDEIVVQGDVQDEIYELVLKTWKQVPKTSIQLTSK